MARLRCRHRWPGWGCVGGGYPTLITCLTDGSRVLTDVYSFTAKHPSQVARELTALQANRALCLPDERCDSGGDEEQEHERAEQEKVHPTIRSGFGHRDVWSASPTE